MNDFLLIFDYIVILVYNATVVFLNDRNYLPCYLID